MSNKVGIVIIGLFILIVGCENDPLELTPSNGQTLVRTVFTLSENSSSIQDSVIIGKSGNLYSGYINDTETSIILLSLNTESFLDSTFCLPNFTIENEDTIYLSLKSSIPLTLTNDLEITELIDEANFDIYFSTNTDWSEESNLNSTLNDYAGDLITETDTLDYNIIGSNLNINISELLKDGCESEDYTIIISYKPESPQFLQLLEFHSSNYTDNYSNYINKRPYLLFGYSIKEEVEMPTNKFLIEQIAISEELLGSGSSVHVVNNIASEDWGRIYLLNQMGSGEYPEKYINESIYIDDLDDSDPVVPDSLLFKIKEILTLTIKLNPDVSSQFDTLSLSIFDDSIRVYSNIDDDLANDNYHIEYNPDGTEGNGELDWTDKNDDELWNPGEGEKWEDFGSDHCPNEFEDGDGTCLDIYAFGNDETCTSLDESENHSTCVYNATGTEGNEVRDFDDLNLNGTWDDGEPVETWEDFGSDGCPDKFEVGDEEKNCDITLNHDAGSDYNSDNYIVDPKGDDYDCGDDNICPCDDDYPGKDDNEGIIGGSECNGLYELGEEFLDIGCDGIPQLIDTDGTQNDGIFQSVEDCLLNEDYDPGIGEYLLDTGEDGIYSGYDEEGEYPYNPLGNEGNLSYQVGERFNDFGVDNIKDDDDGDDASDNYNIDPNDDNELDEGNDIYDQGEFFYDDGVDGIPDASEVFVLSNLLNVNTGTKQGENVYDIIKNITETIPFDMPDTTSSDVVLWISEIKKIGDDNVYDLTFSIFATKEIKCLSFLLTHNLLNWVDLLDVNYSFSSIYNNEKLVKDITIYNADTIAIGSPLSLNYSSQIDSKLIFNGNEEYADIESFINNNSNSTISKEYTKLVIPFERDEENLSTLIKVSLNRKIEDNYELIDLDGDVMTDVYKIYPESSVIKIDFWADIQRLIHDGIDTLDYIIKIESTEFDFSKLNLLSEEAYLEIVHSQ